MFKNCFKCGQSKPLGDFYKHKAMRDGYLGKCKECTKADVLAHRQENLEKIREYDRERSMLPHRVQARKEYGKTENGKAARKRAMDNFRKNNKEKYKAHTMVKNALRNGSIQKPEICSSCGASGRIEGHHHDYSKPLEIEWLCNSCHRDRHK